MQRSADQSPHNKQHLAALLILTLVSSAVHFADNAFRLDRYPGPLWLTRNTVLLTWLFVLAAACFVYRSPARWSLIAYGALGFAGLAHYLMPHGTYLPLRCAITIDSEAATSALLIAYALFYPRPNKQVAA